MQLPPFTLWETRSRDIKWCWQIPILNDTSGFRIFASCIQIGTHLDEQGSVQGPWWTEGWCIHVGSDWAGIIPSYLPASWKEISGLLLSNGIVPEFQISAKKRNWAGGGGGGSRLLNKLPYLIFLLLPTECYISNPSTNEENAEAWQRQ